MKRILASMLIILSCTAIRTLAEPIVVHEWGTFTSLQNEAGMAMEGISQDVEPLPPFVTSLSLSGGKGTPDSVSPQITMRLETPVVYFHLPRNAAPIKLDFSARFRGGLLSQCYPTAKLSFGISQEALTRGGADALDNMTGMLAWENLTVGTGAAGPETDSKVWLAPRAVEAANITASNDQSERYLFYRGVGRLDAPLRVSRNGKQLHIDGQAQWIWKEMPDLRVGDVWYFDVQPDGRTAYRTLSSISVAAGAQGITTAADFDQSEYRADGLVELRAKMKSSLVREGLFEDEADAMLNTWDEAYFKSPGTRVFFVVPRAWVDHYLPVNISVPADLSRVMIGRIDLITPKQRELANRYWGIGSAEEQAQERAQTLAAMGRFANVLLLESARERIAADTSGKP